MSWEWFVAFFSKFSQLKDHLNYSTPAKQEVQAKAELRVLIRDNGLGYAENYIPLT